MPEISDADYELLQLSKKALGGKTRLKTLRALKEADPERHIPELDTEDRISAALSPLQEENRKLREDLDSRTTAQVLKEKRDALRARGLDPAAVEKIMVEKSINSHESAAEFMELNTRVAVPAPSAPSFDRSAQVPVNDGLKKNPAQWARETAASVLDEFKAGKK